MQIKPSKIHKKKDRKKFKKMVKEVLTLVNSILPVSYELKIIEGYTEEMKENPAIAGLYAHRSDVVVISPALLEMGQEEILWDTLLHEIGHSIHYHYFGYRPQYLRRKHKGDIRYYCNSNQKESFAECFKDYCNAVYKGKQKKIEKSERLSKMNRILKEKKEELYV